jgi:hypothetical protein
MRRHFRGVIEMLQAQDQVQIQALEQVMMLNSRTIGGLPIAGNLHGFKICDSDF